MVLIKDKTIMRPPKGMKPTRFRFRDNIRLGFRNNRVVEITKFKEVKRMRRKKK
ncbi:hypothetical protein LCGC14_0465360 [marine sediment metagenome]|uniref:Uncharacterized protein n=1 Tax=marine sediment metagenome TaxID=412755 RepID=A0A0F9SWI5_9ZZZZ